MANGVQQHTPGEMIFAISIASVCAVLAAIVGFVGAIFLCGWILSGEMTEWDLILAPAAALLFGTAAFVATYRWIARHGDPPSVIQ
jgi:ABC-type multidrug transport system permease subunit